MKRLLFAFAGISFAVLMTALLAELAIRVANPRPPVQVISADVRPPGSTLRDAGGSPVWYQQGSEARENEGCRGDQHVAVYGTSISWGIQLPHADTFGPRLEQLLAVETGQRWCVHDYSQPGFAGGNKLARMRETVAGSTPDVVLWELWWSDPGWYVWMGDDAVQIGGLRLDGEGLPSLVPAPPLNRFLLGWSKLYRYAVLTTQQVPPEQSHLAWRRWYDEVLPQVEAHARGVGARLGVFMPSRLSTSFEHQADHPNELQRGLFEDLEAREIRWLHLADAFRGQSVEALRIDPCCHLNAAGHAAMAEALLPVVMEARTPSSPRSTTPTRTSP
jgi:hypothetical protein